MDPQSIKKFLVPAVAVAALILVGALIIGNSGAPPKTASSANPKDRGPIVKEGADTSAAGMSDTMPSESNWTVLTGGLKYKDVKEGTGETISAGQTAHAHYSGWLALNGFEFDSSRKGGKPLEFQLRGGPGGVIQGWVSGIPGMKVGGIRRFYIPAAMGYGERGFAPDIPPGADLVFEVKLIGFQ